MTTALPGTRVEAVFRYRLPEALLAIRARRGLSDMDVAREIGVCVREYSAIERGAVYPDALTVGLICRVLGCSADELLGWA